MKLRILTFNLEVSLGGEIVALPHRAGVPTSVSRLRLLDDQGEGVLVGLKPKLGTFVAFLGGENSFIDSQQEFRQRTFNYSPCSEEYSVL